MKKTIVLGALLLLIILSSGCLSNGSSDNFSKISYRTQMTGVTYTGTDCIENPEGCNDNQGSFGDGIERWSVTYTEEEWNESTNINFTELINEAVPGGYSRIDVLMDDKFVDGPNEYYLQYKADIINPNQKISILYKVWIERS